MDQIKGTVDKIIFRSEETGFTVFRCIVTGYIEDVTIVGNVPGIHAGSVLDMQGEWSINPKYGKQFKLEKFSETLPATAKGIEKYLASGLVKGIGTLYARNIVKKFGVDTLRIIDEEPERLMEVYGIGKKRIAKITASWEEQKEVKDIMLFLQDNDISTTHAVKIYRTYGADSIGVIKENPYRLADDIWGIGFKTADGIAGRLGFGKDDPLRLESGIKYTLNRLSDAGHCYSDREMLCKEGGKLLGASEQALQLQLDHMIGDESVINEEGRIYLPAFYYTEKGVASRLIAINRSTHGFKVDSDGLDGRIAGLTGMDYDYTQMRGIMTAAESKVMILTGGPGTGKTTTTLGIITAYKRAGASVRLAAPTGRAAKRMSEATGMEAVTIHRLLEARPPSGYQRDEKNPIDGDVLIVDECSMIDIMLMYSLLKAVPNSMTLIMVGDIDQLPSVGSGNVLRDVIDSGAFPVVKLEKIFRQAETSKIITNAHRINKGLMPEITNDRESDFFFCDIKRGAERDEVIIDEPSELAAYCADTVVDLVTKRLPEYYGVSPEDIQVLAPMKKGYAGTANLNQRLQEALNPEGDALKRGGTIYRKGDKVMQIRNNYDKGVFNGDIGYIIAVDTEDKELLVKYDEQEVLYDITELDEVTLAYACTIHKSQGSEYPVVVMPLLMSHYVMLQRNLVYTGITRAKKLLVIAGDKKALAYSVGNVIVEKRNTRLCERIRENAELQ